jgi:hypothetical protein
VDLDVVVEDVDEVVGDVEVKKRTNGKPVKGHNSEGNERTLRMDFYIGYLSPSLVVL